MKKRYQKFWIRFELFFKNLFKYKHGYARYCNPNNAYKCPVCSTPWPHHILLKNKIEEYENIYFEPILGENSCEIYGNFDGGYLTLPKGVKAEEVYKKKL